MSIQAIAAVLDTDVGEASAKMLLVSIANAHNGATGLCCPSIDRLASESSMSRSTVKRWLRWLEEHKFIAVERRKDATGRQQSHAYRLTLSEGFILTPSKADDPQDVVEPELNPREVTGEPVEGFTAEPPLKKPEEEPSPQPPASGGPRFDELVKEWPYDHLGNLDNAAGAFAKLSSDERASAVRAAAAVVMVLSRRRARIPALAAYIRNRVFLEFDGAPKVDEDGRFIITPDRPEWGPWLGWLRDNHGQRAVDDTVKRKFWLPLTRWPSLDQARAQAVH